MSDPYLKIYKNLLWEIKAFHFLKGEDKTLLYELYLLGEELYRSFGTILTGGLIVLGSEMPKKIEGKNRFKLHRAHCLGPIYLFVSCGYSDN